MGNVNLAPCDWAALRLATPGSQGPKVPPRAGQPGESGIKKGGEPKPAPFLLCLPPARIVNLLSIRQSFLGCFNKRQVIFFVFSDGFFLELMAVEKTTFAKVFVVVSGDSLCQLFNVALVKFHELIVQPAFASEVLGWCASFLDPKAFHKLL